MQRPNSWKYYDKSFKKSTLLKDFTPPPPPPPPQQTSNLKTLKIMPRNLNKLYANEFGFSTAQKMRKFFIAVHICQVWTAITSPRSIA
jgi:hypothetical protein